MRRVQPGPLGGLWGMFPQESFEIYVLSLRLFLMASGAPKRLEISY